MGLTQSVVNPNCMGSGLRILASNPSSENEDGNSIVTAKTTI